MVDAVCGKEAGAVSPPECAHPERWLLDHGLFKSGGCVWPYLSWKSPVGGAAWSFVSAGLVGAAKLTAAIHVARRQGDVPTVRPKSVTARLSRAVKPIVWLNDVAEWAG